MNDRENLILKAIIQHYLEYGESVGSRTLEKKYNIGVSSATIRNAMSDLEEKGLIIKTHTSSGRVPTNEGYKLYIDELVKIRDISSEEKERIVKTYNQKMHQIDMILEETSRLLSRISNYAGIVLEPSIKEEKIKKVELIHINETNLLMVVVMDSNITKTQNISLKVHMEEKEVKQLAEFINNEIKVSASAFTITDLENFLMKMNIFRFERLEEDKMVEENKMFFDGGTRLIESSSLDVLKVIDRAKLLSNPHGMKAIFTHLINKGNYTDGEVNIVFGEDFGVTELEDLSFVFSVYTLGNSKGVIGVIGPKRMEYSKTVGLVEYVSEEVGRILKDNKNSRLIKGDE